MAGTNKQQIDDLWAMIDSSNEIIKRCIEMIEMLEKKEPVNPVKKTLFNAKEMRQCLKAAAPKNKETTNSTYIESYKQFLKNVNNPDQDKILEWAKTKKEATRHKYLKNIRRCLNLQAFPTDKIHAYVVELGDVVKLTTYTRKGLTESEKKCKISFDEFIELRQNLFENRDFCPQLWWRVELMCWGNSLMGLRPSEYCGSVIGFSDDKNYIDLSTRTFHIKAHKTSRKNGERVIPVDDAIMEGIEFMGLKSGQKLVPCKAKQFTDYMRKKTGTIPSYIRTLLCSHKSKEPLTCENIAERKAYANAVGHTLETEQLVYNKFSELV